MIRLEITCDYSTEPRAHDAKHPCDSTRARGLVVDTVGTMDDAAKAVKRQCEQRGWSRMLIPRLGRRMGYVCGPCARRAKGEI